MVMKTYDILPSTHGGWKCVERGTDHMVAGYETKERLLQAMQEKARQSDEAMSLRIHTADGRFEEERTCPDQLIRVPAKANGASVCACWP